MLLLVLYWYNNEKCYFPESIFELYCLWSLCFKKIRFWKTGVLIAIGFSTNYTRCTLHITGALSDYSSYIIA